MWTENGAKGQGTRGTGKITGDSAADNKNRTEERTKPDKLNRERRGERNSRSENGRTKGLSSREQGR